MPDSAQEKTEAPTPRRREEARRQGQVAKSTDLSAAVILLGGLLFVALMSDSILGRLLDITRYCLGGNAYEIASPRDMMTTTYNVMSLAVKIVLPVLFTVLVLALLSVLVQVGFMITFEPLKPSFSKINPISGLKRMFSGKSFMQLVMGIAKAGLLAVVAYYSLKSKVPLFAYACYLDHVNVVGLAATTLFTLSLRLAITLLVLAILDYFYQRYRHEKDLKMTKEEVKDEMKNMDGDPKIKQKRRQVQMQMAMQRIKSAVPQADVVVTNPTELAIAIRYDSETMQAPKVVAKGADFMARRIREIAIEHGIPIVERKPLARALYKAVEVGQEVPVELYKAVAEILAYVYELSGRRTSAAAAAAAMN
jgi:flagellar biosynthetic protein FlhB